MLNMTGRNAGPSLYNQPLSVEQGPWKFLICRKISTVENSSQSHSLGTINATNTPTVEKNPFDTDAKVHQMNSYSQFFSITTTITTQPLCHSSSMDGKQHQRLQTKRPLVCPSGRSRPFWSIWGNTALKCLFTCIVRSILLCSCPKSFSVSSGCRA